MSEFSDVCQEGLEAALDTIGRTQFEIGGILYVGDWSDTGRTADVGPGGETITFAASIVAPVGQFSAVPRAGVLVRRVKDQRLFRIKGASSDEVAITLDLDCVNK